MMAMIDEDEVYDYDDHDDNVYDDGEDNSNKK